MSDAVKEEETPEHEQPEPKVEEDVNNPTYAEYLASGKGAVSKK